MSTAAMRALQWAAQTAALKGGLTADQMGPKSVARRAANWALQWVAYSVYLTVDPTASLKAA